LTTSVHTVNISQDYDLHEYVRESKLVGCFGYFRNLTETSAIDNYTFTMGLTKKIHEKWGISANAGGRYTHSDLDVSTDTSQAQLVAPRSDDLGWIGNLAISYSGEKQSASLTLSEDVVPLSGRAGTTERTGVVARFDDKFTSEFSGFLEFEYFRNRLVQDNSSTLPLDENSLKLNCGLHYDFSDYLSLEGNYQYRDVHYSQSSERANQNIFMLRLAMKLDLMDL
jgi:hypothetical protein